MASGIDISEAVSTGLDVSNAAVFEGAGRSEFPLTFNMFLASKASRSLMVCLPGPPASSTEKHQSVKGKLNSAALYKENK